GFFCGVGGRATTGVRLLVQGLIVGNGPAAGLVGASPREAIAAGRQRCWLAVSASACNAFEYPCCEWCVRASPYVSLLEGPGIDRVAVANQLEQAWFVEVLRRPLVHALQPRHDHRVVEYPAKTVLGDDVALHVKRQRIAVWYHAAEGEEHPGDPQPRIAQTAERGQWA